MIIGLAWLTLQGMPLRSDWLAGELPLGRVGPAALQAKVPFHGCDVAVGQYELSTAMPLQAPLLQVCLATASLCPSPPWRFVLVVHIF